MDAPVMVMNKHVPEDFGLRNIAAAEEEGGQGQMHRGGEEKQHKPMLKKVKDKVKKIKNTIAGGGGGHGGGAHNAGAGDRAAGNSSSSSSEEGDGEDAPAVRVGDVDQGGYQEDVEDKPVAMESDPEDHGAPMYDSAKVPAVKEVERDGVGGGDAAPTVRLGDIHGDVVEDPAVPHSATPAPREGEDIGATPVVRAFEKMSVSDGSHPKHVGAGKPDEHLSQEPMPVSSDVTAGGGGGEEWKDAPTDVAGETTPEGAAASGGATTYTEKIKSAAAGTTEYGKKLASTLYEKVAGVGTVVVGKVQAAGSAIPGVGGGGASQNTTHEDTTTTAATAASEPAASGGQDKGATVTGYIADKLRPGDEDRELSAAISGAVQRRKEDVAQRVPAAPVTAPAQVLAKARSPVTSLAGGTRVSETVQPTTTTTDEANVMADGTVVEEAPVVRGEEIGDPQPNISMT